MKQGQTIIHKTYEFEIPKEDKDKIIKGAQCPLFPNRIQGSMKCINCTYCVNLRYQSDSNVSYACAQRHYDNAHHAKTIKMLRLIKKL